MTTDLVNLPLHAYLSTACLHGRHERCDSMIGVDGTKRPATCKYCDARCVCAHHEFAQQEEGSGMTHDEVMSAIRGPGSSTRRAIRPGLPGYGIVIRFGAPVIVMGPGHTVAYTPTREDFQASDWTIAHDDGSRP